jgi:short subunit dehydrogenase-like uncharacterized protein
MIDNKEFDLILFGATSFVGKILSEYLVGEHIESNLSWAMAARSRSKLNALREDLGPKAAGIPVIVADSFDEEALYALCGRTHVVISTVGPYALYGDLLIKICAELGTDYCDLTGEAQWIRRIIAEHETTAQASGARIVNCCGFDSIPSDLGVKFLQDLAQEHFGAYCKHVKMRVKGTKGGASGGTIASAINLFQEAAKDSSLRQELKDPYSICPEGHHFKARQKTIAVEYDEDFNSWTGPFLMAAINQRVVLRTNALLSPSYDANFTYDEGTLTGDGRGGEKRAKRLSTVTRIGMICFAVPPVRWLATRFFLPKPGEGPSPEQQDKGFFDLRFFGSNDQGGNIIVKVTGDKDPGYGATAKMLAQAGISLCRDVDKGSFPGGFWTPASIFGVRLFERLQTHAGMTFEALSVSNPRSSHSNVTDMD